MQKDWAIIRVFFLLEYQEKWKDATMLVVMLRIVLFLIGIVNYCALIYIIGRMLSDDQPEDSTLVLFIGLFLLIDAFIRLVFIKGNYIDYHKLLAIGVQKKHLIRFYRIRSMVDWPNVLSVLGLAIFYGQLYAVQDFNVTSWFMLHLVLVLLVQEVVLTIKMALTGKIILQAVVLVALCMVMLISRWLFSAVLLDNWIQPARWLLSMVLLVVLLIVYNVQSRLLRAYIFHV